MSSPVTNNTVVAPVKDKKPNLPAKFAKFMQFGYFFVSSVKDAGLLDDSSSRELLDRLCVFSSVDEQKAFYEGWLSSAKESNKALRKELAARRKANLPPKPRAPRVKKEVDPNAPPKEKKPRAKKDQSNALINELASLTSAPVDPIPAPPDNLTTEVAVKKLRKPRAKKDDPKPVESKPADSKPAKKTKKTADKPLPTSSNITATATAIATATANTTANDPDDDGDDLDVREFLFDGKTYLIDDNTSNVFDLLSHDHIGLFNQTSNQILFL